MNKKVSFTEQEANALISMLDDAVKAKGLSVAQNALHITGKLQEAFKAADEVKVPAKK